MGIHQIVLFQRITDPLVEMRNTFYVGGTGTTIVDALNAMGTLLLAYQSFIKPVLSTRWSLYGVGIRDASIPGTQLLSQTITGFTGDRPEDLMPPQVSGTCFWKTGTPPPNRKWTKIGGFTEASIGADGQLVVTSTAALQNLVDEILAHNAAELDTAKFVAAHYDTVEQRHVSSNALVAGSTSPVTGTQRSRIIGRGI